MVPWFTVLCVPLRFRMSFSCPKHPFLPFLSMATCFFPTEAGQRPPSLPPWFTTHPFSFPFIKDWEYPSGSP